jgi:AcrR family transcriptional regulator
VPRHRQLYGVKVTDTRARITAATRRILEAEGAGAVSMRRIAAECDLSAMAPYWHFPNREVLLEETCQAAFEEVAADWRGHTPGEDPLAELHAVADLLIDFALTRPRLYDYLFTAPRPGARRYPDDFAAGRSPTLNVLIDALTRGMAQGLLRADDPVGVALTLAAQFHGLIALHHGGRTALPDDAFRALCHRNLERILDGITP